VLLQRLQDLVGVQFQVPHHLREGVPLHLREREEDVLVGQQRVVAAPRLLDRAVHDSLPPIRRILLCAIESKSSTGQLFAGVHHDRPVPGHRLLERLARHQQEADALFAGLHGDLVAGSKSTSVRLPDLVAHRFGSSPVIYLLGP
jgi:hypothetical protein